MPNQNSNTLPPEVENLVRPCVRVLKPYSCARDEFKGEAKIFLDANENPYPGTGLNRYPDPLQTKIKERLRSVKCVAADHIMLGNGSDEPIDLVYRIFCNPGSDNVVAIAPTYGMYRVCADINDVEYRESLLNPDDFSMSADALLAKCDERTKVIWLCSPNNPTGNTLATAEIERLLREFQGMVVIDEAYCDFSGEASWLRRLEEFPRLIVLQTFSKAWGMAAARCGMCFASPAVIGLFNKVKYPYNVNQMTQEAVLGRLDKAEEVKTQVAELLAGRDYLADELAKLPFTLKVYPSQANFVLVRFTDANAVYKFLVGLATITRNRNTVALCQGCVRITVGTPDENAELIRQLKQLR